MAKVLRLHKGAADTIGNWDTSVKIGTKAIDSIADPIGANDKHEITSIPSPFARMDLVKRAFKIVAEGSLEGKTAYHKLVSDLSLIHIYRIKNRGALVLIEEPYLGEYLWFIPENSISYE